jgi:hypothetical protein
VYIYHYLIALKLVSVNICQLNLEDYVPYANVVIWVVKNKFKLALIELNIDTVYAS